MVLNGRPLTMQAFRLRQGEARCSWAPGGPKPRLGLLSRLPALYQPRRLSRRTRGCIAHALPALLESFLEPWILHSSIAS